MTADGRYAISAEMKGKPHERVIDSSQPPDGRMLPSGIVFEPSCSVRWMDVFGRISVGSVSNAVSGRLTNVTIGRDVSIGEGVRAGRDDRLIAWLRTSPFFHPPQGTFPVGRDFEGAEAGHAVQTDAPGTAHFVRGDMILIENDAWIGHRAHIRPGVTIGTGADRRGPPRW